HLLAEGRDEILRRKCYDKTPQPAVVSFDRQGGSRERPRRRLAESGLRSGASCEGPEYRGRPAKRLRADQPRPGVQRSHRADDRRLEARLPQPVSAPEGAPNILLILTDDVGFGASSAFGGPVPTPTLEALAADGLKYNAFNTTALCSPTRAALITGRDQ